MSPESIPLKGEVSPSEGRMIDAFITRAHPPNLRLVVCCAQCRHGKPEGISVECHRFQTNGICLYAICDQFEEGGSP